MKFSLLFFVACLFCIANSACSNDQHHDDTTKKDSAQKGSYAYDVAFIKKHSGNIVELKNADSSARVLLSADMQGRVLTSTATGDTGNSFGWLNYNLISAAEKKKQFNPYGGEERFWLGPEGGQYSLYFKGGDSFNINHWQVPALEDTEPFNIQQSDNKSVTFTKAASITNYSGTTFSMNISRTVHLLNASEIQNKLQANIPAGLHTVAYETINELENTGDSDWTKDKGLVSIWLLGMFTPSPQTMVIIPFHGVPDAKQHITTNYFGEIPADRLQIKDSVVFFTCDGKYRSKLGIAPLIAKPVAAGFDFEKNVLTLVLPEVHPNAAYVNSKWELQKEPYKGDVINSYNDGPLADGTQMGPFFEIESSSPALALKHGEKGTYTQTTMHFSGDYASLKQLAMQLLGVDLDQLKK